MATATIPQRKIEAIKVNAFNLSAKELANVHDLTVKQIKEILKSA